MTPTTNSRLAGATFLLYIALGVSSMILFNQATGGDGVAEKLTGINEHAGAVRAGIIVSLLTCFAALVLGVTLYALTRDVDADIALLALACRVAEGVLGAASFRMPRLLWLATAGADAPDPATASALGEFLLMPSFSTPIGATFFAVGSALFAYLLLRGHLISVPLAWLGIVGSVLLVAGLPLELTGLIGSPWTGLMWAPLAVFEVVFGLWLILKGVTTRSAPAVTTLPTQHAL